MSETAVKTVDRTAAILMVLAKHGPAGVPLTEIAEETGLSKGTAHRLLLALANVGFTFQNLATRRYCLGSAAAALGGTAQQHNAATVAQPILERIAEATEDTVFASTRESSAAVCVGRAIGSYPIRTLTLDVGSRRPLGVGSGSLALLAALPDAEVSAIIARNSTWLRDFHEFSADEILKLVERTRRNGYATNEGRIVSAMSAVAVAVLDADRRPFVSFSIAAINERMTPDRIPRLVRILENEARALEQALQPHPVMA